MGRKRTTLRNRILKKAQVLFSEKGYENTSVNDIIKSLGVSKGAFYHYFTSKDEVLDAIIMEYSYEMINILYAISYDSSLNALEKYKKMFSETQTRRRENSDKLSFLTNMFLSEENLLFRHRYTEKIIELTKPPFVEILKQGLKEGLFIINNPEETAELIMRFSNIYRTKLAVLMMGLKENPGNLLKIQNIIEFMQDIVERMLGLDSGTLDIIAKEFQMGIRS
jgi:AcrR family transcriptional regulator